MTSRRGTLFPALLIGCSAAGLGSCGTRTDLNLLGLREAPGAPAFERLVVADLRPGQEGRLLAYASLEQADYEVLRAGPFTSPCSPTFDGEGRLAFIETAAARIVRVDLRTGSIEPTNANLPWLSGSYQDLAVDGRGGFYATAPNDSGIVHLDSIGAEGVLFADPGLGRPTGVGVTPDGKIVIVDGLNARLVQIDDMTGVGWRSFELQPGSVPTTGEELLFDLAIDDAGRMYFAGRDNSLHRIDDISGKGHVTFEVSSEDGGPVSFRGVTIGPDDRIYTSVETFEGTEIWSLADMDGSDLVKLDKPGDGTPDVVCGGPALR